MLCNTRVLLQRNAGLVRLEHMRYGIIHLVHDHSTSKMDAGFFRGTSADQDSRFSDKEKKLMKNMKFEDVLSKKVDMEKVNLDTIKPWITKRITELLGMEDEIVNGLIFEMLNNERHPDPKNIQITLTGFLQGKNARVFMGELWDLLVSAQENIGGIPTAFLEKKKEEIRLRKIEQDRINAHIRRSAGEFVAEADSTIPGPEPGEAGLTAAELAAVKAQALKLAKDSNPSRDVGRSDENERNPITVLGAGMVTPQRTVKKDLSGYTSSPASTPTGRNTKPGWYAEHDKFVHIAQTGGAGILLIGDSIINGLSRYSNVWSRYFGPLRALNFGIGGDRTQHVLWRVENGEIPLNLHICVIHCGTNNIDRDTPSDITDGITSIVSVFQTAKPNAKIIITGLLPRDLEPGYRRQSIRSVNKKLKRWCQSPSQRNVYFLKPDNDWILPDGTLRTELYYTDYLHLGEPGNEKFAKSIYDLIMKLMQGVKIDYTYSSEEDIENEESSTNPPAVNDLRDKLNNLKAEKGKPKGKERESRSRSFSRSKSRSVSRSRSRSRSKSRRRSRSRSKSRSRSRRRSVSRSRRRRYRSRSHSPRRRSRSPARYRSPRRRRFSPPRRHSRSPSRSPRRGRDTRRIVKRRSSSSGSSRSPSPRNKKALASPSPPPTHRRQVKVERETSGKKEALSSSDESIKEKSKSPVHPVSNDQLGSPKYHKAEKAQGRAYRTKRSVSSSISPEKERANEKEAESSHKKSRDKKLSPPRGERRSESPPRRRRSPPRGERNRSPFYNPSQRRRSPPKSPPRRYRRESPPPKRRYRSPSESPPRRVARRRSPSPRRRSPSPRRRSPSPMRRQSPVRRRRDASPSPRRPPRRPSPPRRRRSPSEDWSPSPSPQRREVRETRAPRQESERSESSSESEAEMSKPRQKREKRMESEKSKTKEKMKKRKRSPSPSSESESEDDEKVEIEEEKKEQKRIVTVKKRTPISSESDDDSGSEEEQKKRKKKKKREKKEELSEGESASESDDKPKKKHRHQRKEKKRSEKKKLEKKMRGKERSESPSPDREEQIRRKRKKEPSESEKVEKRKKDITAQAKDRHGRPVHRLESPMKSKKDRKASREESEESESELESKQVTSSPEKKKRKPERDGGAAVKAKRKNKRKEESQSEESEGQSGSEGDVLKRKMKKRSNEEGVDQMAVERSSEGSEVEITGKDKKKKKHRKHKKLHSRGSSKHKKRKHKKQKGKRKDSADESETSESEEESAELERKLREKALQSMQRHQKQSSSSD